MRRQCCAGCGTALGLKQYYKALSYKVTCGGCGQRHNAKAGSRWTVALLIGSAPIVIMTVTGWVDLDRGWRVPLVLAYMAAIYALLPWLLRIVPEQGE